MNTYAKPRIVPMPPSPAMPRRQGGLSLVELMISIAIGLILLVGIAQLIANQSRARDELEKSSRQIENGRYAAQVLHDDIQLGGYYGDYVPGTGVATNVPANPCAGVVATDWNATTPTVPVAIFGYAPSSTAPPSTAPCLSNQQPNTSAIVVQRVSSIALAAASAVPAVTYLQVSDCTKETNSAPITPFMLGTVGTFSLHKRDCTNLADIRQINVNIYYVASCDVCSPSDNIPTLKLVQNGVTTPLVEGIENMQLEYGIDNDSDGYPDVYTDAPGPTDWQNVMSVRLNLLARNNDPTTGFCDTKTYNLGNSTPGAPAVTVGPFGKAPYALAPDCGGAAAYPQLGNYKRHVFTELVRVVNPSGRRANQ